MILLQRLYQKLSETRTVDGFQTWSMREHLRREDIPWRELAFLEILDALRIVLPPQRQAEPWQPSEDDRAAFEELQRSCCALARAGYGCARISRT